MPNFNKVILMGQVTRTPELRQISSGTNVTDVNILTKRTWLGPQGEERTSNDWVDATFWGKQAENVCKFFTEGKTDAATVNRADGKTLGRKINRGVAGPRCHIEHGARCTEFADVALVALQQRFDAKHRRKTCCAVFFIPT